MALLGDDGRGYELARKLEGCGVWRSWLGDSQYANFVHLLSSPSTWEAFMRTDDSRSRAQIYLQLRVRALLFDKASVSLYLQSSSSQSTSSASPLAISKLNPNYLQLHGDDIYFTLENSSQGGVPQRELSTLSAKIQPKIAYGVGSRYGDSEVDNISQRFRHEELPETWYHLFFEKYKASRPYSLSFGNRELDKRTPEDMAAYVKLLDKHKRRRVAFKEDQCMGFGNPIMENKPIIHPNSVFSGNNSVDDDTSFFPETTFTLNCVPDSALPLVNRMEEDQKMEFYGVLDTLPQVTTRSSVTIERLGIRPELLRMEQGGSQFRKKNGSDGKRIYLGEEQASQISQKEVARMLTSIGFEGSTEVPLKVMSQLFTCHISKLGHILKVLADSYRKQCSAIELLKMFLQSTGYSFGALAELVKDGTRISVQQTQQVQGMQSQLQSSLRQPQQNPRQMHMHMQQMVQPQRLTFQQQQQQQQQQQWDRMQRRQAPVPRSGVDMDKDRPLVQVKIENPPEMPTDGGSNNAFNSMNARHSQMQLRQQQIAMTNLHPQSANQFRQQMTSLQIPQIQSPNMGVVRAQPVKVEGFQELMGGDASLSEGNNLTSPSK